MPQVLALLWIVTTVAAIAAAGHKGLPVFAPIRTYPGLYFCLAMLAVACLPLQGLLLKQPV